MAKTIFHTVVLCLCCLGLTACQHTTVDPKNTDAICKKLRRQMHFNRHNPNVEASWNTKRQRQRLEQLYHEYNCE